MTEHYIVHCSCGRLLRQCRCPNAAKVEYIEQFGCEECKRNPPHNISLNPFPPDYPGKPNG